MFDKISILMSKKLYLMVLKFEFLIRFLFCFYVMFGLGILFVKYLNNVLEFE